jgi:hypothetical protein
MDQYSAKSKSYSQELAKSIKNTTQSVCLGLCIVLLGSLYYYIQDKEFFMISAALFFIGFIVLMRIHPSCF